MTASARYLVPGARHRAEQTIDRSRFICTIERVSSAADAQGFLREINNEFADATHNCRAYLVGVTRFYGGTDLGTGGLEKAYGGTVRLPLATMPRVERIDHEEITVIMIATRSRNAAAHVERSSGKGSVIAATFDRAAAISYRRSS